MPRFILHVHASERDGVALWGQRVDDGGRATVLSNFEELVATDPGLFSSVPAWFVRPLRHRARIADGKAPRALQLGGVRLASVFDAVRARLRELGEASQSRAVHSEHDVDVLVAELSEQGKRVALGSAVLADPTLVRAMEVDAWARRLADERMVVPLIVPAQYGARAVWAAAPGAEAPPRKGKEMTSLAGALVDARARVGFGKVRNERERAGALPGLEELESLDPRGAALVEALGPQDSGLSSDPHERRRLSALLSRFVDSGLTGVLLKDREPSLVVRVREPDGDRGWLVEVCLREAAGTVHPLAALVAAGDVPSADAMQMMVRVRTHASAMAEQAPEGFAWTLSTRTVSGFLTRDAAALETAGIAVLMPREWAKQRVQVRAEAAADSAHAPPAPKGTGLGQAVGTFRFRVAIGNVELSEEEAESLLAEGAELVKLRGEWVRVDSSTLKAAEKFLSALAKAERAGNGERARAAIMTGQLAPRPVHAKEFLRALRSPEAKGLDLAVVGAGNTAEEEVPAAVGSGRDAGCGSAAAGTSRPGSPSGVEALFGAKVELPALPHPRGLRATLRPYQKRGVDWLSFLDSMELGGILADDMGLGKTMQVLALLVREREDPTGRGWGQGFGGPTLLVCPMSVVGSWQREAKKFAPHLHVHVHHGGKRLRGDTLRSVLASADLVITTYALVVRDFDALGSFDFHRVILDEAQHVKNSDTLVSKHVRSLTPGRRLALTGTPVENDLTDLHSIMQVTNPELLPASEKEFTEQFATPISEGDDAAMAQLNRVIGPFVLRRVKTDRSIISDLPEKREERAFVNITPEQAALYQGLVDDLQEQLAHAPRAPKSPAGGSGVGFPAEAGSESGSLNASEARAGLQRRALVASTLQKMKQVLGHPAHFLDDGSPILRDGEHRSGKLERVDDLLSTIVANNEKALIFTQFTSFAPAMIEHWERRFGIAVPFLHGGVSKADRDAMVNDFQNSPGVPGAMLLSLRAGGTGITLTAANHVIHLDRWWNPAVENQATDRAFRIGQTRNVEVHKLISIGTIEESIDAVLSDKDALAQATIRSGEGWIANLSDTDISKLFAFRAPESEERS